MHNAPSKLSRKHLIFYRIKEMFAALGFKFVLQESTRCNLGIEPAVRAPRSGLELPLLPGSSCCALLLLACVQNNLVPEGEVFVAKS